MDLKLIKTEKIETLPTIMKDICAMCERELITTEHHLIPKKNHKNKWFLKNFTKDDMNSRKIDVCADCHPMIHKFVPSEKELGKYYNTLEKLMALPKIKKFVNWVKGQDGRMSKTKI